MNKSQSLCVFVLIGWPAPSESLLKRTGVEKENEGIKRSLCLLKNVCIDGQAKSKVFWVLACFTERRDEKGSQCTWESIS